MKNPLEKIIAYFALPADEKAKRLGEVFEESIEFFEYFKHVMQQGTPEERRKAVEMMGLLRATLDKETNRIKDLTGFSDEELKAYAQNRSNFSADQWEIIDGAKQTISHQAKEINGIIGVKKPLIAPPEGGKVGKKPKKKTWVRS